MAATSFSHRNLPRLLLQAREAVMAHNRPRLRQHGLSDQQWRVLRVLGEHGTVETGRVAREAFILGPSLTGVLARMERDGLVRRERDPADQRRTVVEATARGRRLVGQLSQAVQAHYQWMEQQLGKDKLAQLYRLLDELIELEQPEVTHRDALRPDGVARKQEICA
ncbi:homoprotocatechuate degradation operon regulator HpaR [Ramlibacter sp.]|uniref:homoprotocatechuate degradation operon regulator HpaR n=1 Tax=Ramlibacter sp. TaxID=1917967 RepID=UPI002FC69630